MVSEGLEGRGASSFWATDGLVLWHSGLSLWPAPKERESIDPPCQGKGPWREEGPTCQLCGLQQTKDPLASSQGYLLGSTPAVPLTPDGVHTFSAL